MNYWSQKWLQQFDCSYLIFLSKGYVKDDEDFVIKVAGGGGTAWGKKSTLTEISRNYTKFQKPSIFKQKNREIGSNWNFLKFLFP